MSMSELDELWSSFITLCPCNTEASFHVVEEHHRRDGKLYKFFFAIGASLPFDVEIIDEASS